MSISLSIDDKAFRAKLKRLEVDTIKKAKNVVELSAREAVDYAKSYTNETVAGVRPNDGERRTHPGGWSDRSSNLVNSLGTERPKVTQGAVSVEFGVTGNIGGAMEYAEILDERDGYSVLAGAGEKAKKSIKKHWRDM